MKKIIACISLVFAMSAGVTALAADTAAPSDNNSVDVNTEATYNTVLITADDYEDEIVYVDQDDTGFAAASNFLLKAGTDTKYGAYTVKMGSASGDTAEMHFIIVEPDTTPDITMTEAYTYQVGDKYDKGFTLKNTSLSGYNKLVFTATNGEDTDTATFELPFTISGESDVNFAVRVTRIPEGVTVTLGVIADDEE